MSPDCRKFHTYYSMPVSSVGSFAFKYAMKKT
jgi:hypothetical protein